jgi:hypothetical protein
VDKIKVPRQYYLSDGLIEDIINSKVLSLAKHSMNLC